MGTRTDRLKIVKQRNVPTVVRVYMWPHGKQFRFSVYYTGFMGYLPGFAATKKDKVDEHIKTHLQLAKGLHLRKMEQKVHPEYSKKPYPIVTEGGQPWSRNYVSKGDE